MKTPVLGTSDLHESTVAHAAKLRALISQKALLRAWYEDIYQRYLACLARVECSGRLVELGSGVGFAQEIIPELETTDILPYPGIDRVVDAGALPYEDGSLRAIFMCNVFHHLKSPQAFFEEAIRCLAPRGRVLVVDQHPGWLARPIYAHIHPEPFDLNADWGFEGDDPLSDANGAQTYNVFVRDRRRLESAYPQLKQVQYLTFSPMSYWLSGGFSGPSLVPNRIEGLVRRLDAWLLKWSPDAGSFVEIELIHKPIEAKSPHEQA